MTLPWLPAEALDLRFMLFADGSNNVQQLDESTVQKAGVSFTGFWDTPTLNRDPTADEFTLTRLSLLYTARGATTMTVRASGDGGLTFPKAVSVALSAGERMRLARVGFGDGVSGSDLRARLELDTDVLVSIWGYEPRLVRRGDTL